MIEERNNSAAAIAPLPPPARFGAPEAAIVALGLALRAALFVLGRSPMDGDEGIMGIMAAHMARAEHFPIYFYAQHYMGTLEIPLAAILAAPGPAAWRFSVWPIRITAAIYFIFLCWTHFRLSDRFFGARAARWSLFFLCVSTFYWVDYSTRLRHAVLMIALGEAMALLALGLIDRWRAGGGVALPRAFLLGLVAGLAWWHYQLIAVFVIALIPIFIAGRELFLLPLRRFPGGRGWDVIAVVRFAAVLLPALALARLSLGWLRLSSVGYPANVGAFLGALLLGVVWCWRVYRSEMGQAAPGGQTPFRPGSDPLDSAALPPPALAAARFAPALLLLGFAVGYSPVMLYLVRLNEEFWIGQPAPLLMRFWLRLRDFMILDLFAFLEITRSLDPENPAIHSVTGRTYANLALYILAAYTLIRSAIRGPARTRLGAAWCLALGAALLALHIVLPRPTDWNSPRFLVPLCAAAAMSLGLIAAELETGLRAAFPRAASPAVFAAIFAGAVALWLPGWKPRAGERMSWPSGHRAEAMEILAKLREHEIERVDMPRGTEYVLLGYELAFASRLERRFHRGSLGDRLVRIVDETRYRGKLHWLARPPVLLDPETGKYVPAPVELPPGSFWAGRYYVLDHVPEESLVETGFPDIGEFTSPPN